VTQISRTYRCVPKGTINPAVAGGVRTAANGYADLDGHIVNTAHQYVTICMSGTTAQRPATGDLDVLNVLHAPTFYCDTSLSKIVLWQGDHWIDPITGAAV